MSEVTEILKEREAIYGNFFRMSAIADDLFSVMRATPNWHALAADQRIALIVSAIKTARILNGDPDHIDSWQDIAGYAQLVAQRLAGKGK